MKDLLFTLLLCPIMLLAQKDIVKDGALSISLKDVQFNPNLSGGYWQYGKDEASDEKLKDVFLNVTIAGFDSDIPIDFNHFSLVEHDNKLRQRPYQVVFQKSGWASYEISKYVLGTIDVEDQFLKYSQEGIADYDHYYHQRHPFSIERIQQRFYLFALPAKKNKSNNYFMIIPVKTRTGGEMSLYYKDQLVKKFTLEKGKRLRFDK